ncbi:hypothetical protein CEP54_011860 [Fusarium duplospermum]|uniref:Uncharacterized protein n=1 Tax=Fusarium duplospermum TaxID=1325734 RepID=A0A428PC71_9HYPO|nr:hypothetical protein CEP54_011860 [Fusarium duplospermum]
MNMVAMSIIMRVITDMVITMDITRHIAMDTMKAIVMDMDTMRLIVTDTARLIVTVITKNIAMAIVKITAMDMTNSEHHGHHHHGSHHRHGLSRHRHPTKHHRHGHLHPHYHHHHTHHSHPIRPCYILTEKSLCRDLYILAEKADHATHLVQTSLCRQNSTCWDHIREAIYKLEYGLDLFDKYVDHTTLDKCFTRSEEAVVTKCYIHYAQSVIRLLKVTHESGRYLEGEVDRPILTAINSLRAADRAFVLDLGRRIESKESLKVIMRKQGAEDGTTGDSVQEAFNRLRIMARVVGSMVVRAMDPGITATVITVMGITNMGITNMGITNMGITNMGITNMEVMDMDMESMSMDITAMDMNMVIRASTVVLRSMAMMEVTPRLFLMFERARMAITMFITTGIIMATREVITTDMTAVIIMVITMVIRRATMSFTGTRMNMVTATITVIIMGKSMAITRVTMRLTSTRMSMAMGTSTVMATGIRKATAMATKSTIMRDLYLLRPVTRPILTTEEKSRPLTLNPTQEQHRFHEEEDDVESSNAKTSPYGHYRAKEHLRPKNRHRGGDGHCDDEKKHHGKGDKYENINHFLDKLDDEEDSRYPKSEHNGRDHGHHDSPYRHYEDKHGDRKYD